MGEQVHYITHGGEEVALEGRRIWRWELIGVVVVFLVGSALHFLYEWIPWAPIAWLGPVNESTWEHFKLVFWPMLGYAGLEWWRFRREGVPMWGAKGVGLLVGPVVMASFFYIYTAFVGNHVLWLDVLGFLLSAVAGQGVSGYLIVSGWQGKVVHRVGVGLLVLLLVMFVVFTYFPPHLFLFADPRFEGVYGIIG